jgi:tetratricopeptide (TPR) repeat protein
MMFRKYIFLALLVALMGPTLLAADKEKDMCSPPPGAVAPALPAKLLTGQGKLHFSITTTSAEAQQFFDQGVAQMHSFWAYEAERSFLQAAALDPAAPMPQWGIAMVAAGDYRPRFQLDRDQPAKAPVKIPDRYAASGGMGRARAAAQKAVALSAAPGKATELEKMYILAVAARRDPESADPDDGYIQGLRAIAAKYPDEVEAKSYLALHLMRGFTLPDRKPRPGSMEAVAILRELLAKFPDHFGVHHYIIHGFEGSTFARDAWPSCRRYPELVNNIPHALHMPGHIWAQTGKWDEAIRSFESAKENELGYIHADALYGRYHHGHNVAFLIVSYAFAGEYDKAMETARGLLQFTENPRDAAKVDDPYTPYRQAWFGVLRPLVNFEKWDEILDGKTLPLFDKPREQAWRHWAAAMALASKGAVEAAKGESRAMDAALKDLTARTKEDIPLPLGVARKELDGHLALAQRKTDKALKLFEAAAQMERSLRYTEPPSYPRPVYAVLARKALAAGKLQTAESAFREALDQYPALPQAEAGLAETLKRQAVSGGQ